MKKDNQLHLHPTLLAIALLIEESTTAIRTSRIRFLLFHLTGVAYSSERKISAHHVASTLGAVGLVAGIILASTITIPLTI